MGNFKNYIMKTKIFALVLLIFVYFSNVNAQSAFQVVVKGKGDPVLLFPGFGCTGKVWDETVSALSKTYECHIFTFAGFGNVPPIETPWLMKIKDDVMKYVKDRKLKKPILLGHSLGER
jgi:pimeloyl-ACP methyl ester carboxylesterase